MRPSSWSETPSSEKGGALECSKEMVGGSSC